MSSLAPIGAASAAPPPIAQFAKPPAAPAPSGAAAVDPVKLSDYGRSLSERVANIGSKTVDFAQKFVSDFAHKLFGNAKLSFDSASVDAQSNFAALAEGGGQAFSLQENAHFIGKGSITTADGQRFDFEVEVNYEAELSAASAGGHGPAHPDGRAAPPPAAAPAPESSAPAPPPKRAVPDLSFGGTLDDLFKLLGRDLQGPDNLSLRLLQLFDPATV